MQEDDLSLHNSPIMVTNRISVLLQIEQFQNYVNFDTHLFLRYVFHSTESDSIFPLSNQAFFRSALLWISLWKLWITHRRIVYLEYYVNLSLPQISCRSFRRFVGKAHTSPLFGNFCRNCRILFLLFCRILCCISPLHFAGTLQNILFVYYG